MYLQQRGPTVQNTSKTANACQSQIPFVWYVLAMGTTGFSSRSKVLISPAPTMLLASNRNAKKTSCSTVSTPQCLPAKRAVPSPRWPIMANILRSPSLPSFDMALRRRTSGPTGSWPMGRFLVKMVCWAFSLVATIWMPKYAKQATPSCRKTKLSALHWLIQTKTLPCCKQMPSIPCTTAPTWPKSHHLLRWCVTLLTLALRLACWIAIPLRVACFRGLPSSSTTPLASGKT